jgi:hypothetical protein
MSKQLKTLAFDSVRPPKQKKLSGNQNPSASQSRGRAVRARQMRQNFKKETLWRNRIVGIGERPAGEFVANPYNWRIHPKAQRDALSGVLGEVGWVTGVIVNKTTGNTIDGHARVEEALKIGEDTPVPFIEVELTPEEEATILATFDPIGAMAAADKEQIDALLQEFNTSSQGLQDMISEMKFSVDQASAKDVSGVGSSDRGIGKIQAFKPVLLVSQIDVLENAIMATGMINRGEAIEEICLAYLKDRNATR